MNSLACAAKQLLACTCCKIKEKLLVNTFTDRGKETYEDLANKSTCEVMAIICNLAKDPCNSCLFML